MKKTSKLVLLALVLPCLHSQYVNADQQHYNNVIIGDRANGLGGAYTAISDDPSGLYYNPAGIVYSGKRNLSASVNAFNFSTKTYKDVFGNGEDFVRTSSGLLPNFFGVSQPLAGGIFGFSYAVTDSIIEDQDSSFNNTGATTSLFNLNVNNTDSTFKMGPSFAMEINDELSVGVTLYAHVRNLETIVNQWVRKTSLSNNGTASFEWSNTYIQISEIGIEPIFGVMWSPLDDVSFGMTLRQTSIISTEADRQDTCVSDIPAPATPSTAAVAGEQGVFQCQPQTNAIGTLFVANTARDPALISSDANRTLPLQLNFGAAYFASQSLLVSADLAYYAETDTATSVVNVAAGAEYYLSDAWAMRGGFFTNFANTPDIVSGNIGQDEHINLTGLTFSVSRFTRNSSITGGIGMNFGSGQAQTVANTSIQDVDVFSTSFYVSSSYSY